VQEYLPQVFERFAKEEFRYSSPLYERLSLAIAKDSELLTLAGHGRRGERIPNLLFAAVHFLLLKGVKHPLRRFYPSLPEFSAEASGPYADFRSFCMDHAAEIRQQISARLVQTNEVRRCAGLVPAFEWVRRLAKDRPLHLVDIGTSAGLNLLWDHYAYEYGTAHRCGELSSLVKIKCALQGNFIPPIPLTLPQVSARIGLDLNPLDVHHAEDALWLRALIWPEHRERSGLLEKAIQVVQQCPPTLLRGDGVELLPDLMKSVREDEVLCIVRIFTQLPPQSRDRLSALIAGYAGRRDVFMITLRPHGGDDSELHLTSFIDGDKTEWRLAYLQNHGEWIEWVQLG